MTCTRNETLSLASALFLALCAAPTAVSAAEVGGFMDALILFLYGGIGFFGALAFALFFGGWMVYLARMGQEYRVDGIYLMLRGVRIFFLVLCAMVLLVVLK